MQFRITSYRNGLQILRASEAYDEICRTLEAIEIKEVDRRRAELQEHYETLARKRGTSKPTQAGIQTGLNAILREAFGQLDDPWRQEVAVFAADKATDKGYWTMDFAKRFETSALSVGLEVTFNHGEALTWTPIRLTLAHEAEGVSRDARINVGCIVIGTDNLKGNRREGLRMDSAVGTYERLLTLLPKMRPVLPAPLVIFGLDWADGGLAGAATELALHTSGVSLVPVRGGSESVQRTLARDSGR